MTSSTSSSFDSRGGNWDIGLESVGVIATPSYLVRADKFIWYFIEKLLKGELSQTILSKMLLLIKYK